MEYDVDCDTHRKKKEFWCSEKTCCHSDSSEKPPVTNGVKIPKEYNNINNWMLQISTKGVQDLVPLSGQSDQLGIVQGIKNWSYYQMVYTQTRIPHKNWDA